MALAQLGRALVRQGRVDEGMALLDEAMTVALGGETSDPLACGDACCTTLVVCDGLADLDRATQWCEAVVEFTERRRFIPVQSWCRGIYGAVLVRAGDWERAEAVLTEALARRADRAQGGGRALPLAVLADLRLRQGRDRGGRAAARRARGRAGGARAARAAAPRARRRRAGRSAARARRRAIAGRRERLALRAEVALARGDLDAAATSPERLRGAAAAACATTSSPRPRGSRARGRARGDGAAATRRARGRRPPLRRARAPATRRRARASRSRGAQAAAGSPLALASARAARDAFERLGALADADRAAALLRGLGVAGRTHDARRARRAHRARGGGPRG